MIPFAVTILGSSSATPVYQRHPSAQVLNINHQYILIDAGESVQSQLAKYHLKPGRIGHVLISHLHGDHFLGLPGLLSTLSLHGRTEPLYLFGPADLMPFLHQYFHISETILSYPLIFDAIDPSRQTVLTDTDHFRIEAFPLKHRIACTGFLISEKTPRRKINKELCAQLSLPVDAYGKLKNGEDVTDLHGNLHQNNTLTFPPPKARSYAYCSDTAYFPELCSIVEAVDLLYHEATFTNDRLARAEETFHSTALQAAQIAHDAKVRDLIIGHFSSRYRELNDHLTEAKTVFERTALALEGTTFDVL